MKFGIQLRPEDVFLESTSGKILVRLIKQGRSLNGWNWTEEACRKLAALSHGAPVRFFEMVSEKVGRFFDHFKRYWDKLPDALKNIVPTTFPKNIVGQLENVRYREDEQDVVGELTVLESGKWLREAVELGLRIGKQALGLSVDAEGPVLPGNVPVPATVYGFDCVSHPSAGGEFLAVQESWIRYFEGNGARMKDLWKKLLKVLPNKKADLEKAFPDEGAREQLTLSQLESTAPEIAQAFLEAIGQDPAAGDPPADPAPKPAAKPAGDPAPTPQPAAQPAGDPPAAGAPQAAQTPAVQPQADPRVAQLEAEIREQRREFMESQLEASGLPEEARDWVREQLGQDPTRQLVRSTIATAKKRVAKLLESARPGQPVFFRESAQAGQSAGEKTIQMVDDMLEGKPGSVGIRECYVSLTGDVRLRPRDYLAAGRPFRGLLESVDWDGIPEMQRFLALGHRSLMEAVTTAGFPLILSDRMHKRMVMEYRMHSLSEHLLIAKRVTVSDFKPHRVEKLGEYADLDSVAEGGDYTAFGAADDPSEDTEVSLQLVKFGNTDTITWESVLNDDTGAFRMLPRKIARAARRGEYKAVLDKLGSNPNIYDGTALATVGHGNLQSAILSEKTFWVARKQLSQQKDIDSRFPLALRARYLFHGADLTELAEILTMSTTRPGSLTSATGFDGTLTTTNAAGVTGSGTSDPASGVVNPIQRRNIIPVEVPYWTDTDQAWLIADQADAELIQLSFLQGHEEPELFTQDLPNVGSFFDSEKVTLKGRHIYDCEVVDFRPAQAMVP